jgi:AcrR family transcriptional regulator
MVAAEELRVPQQARAVRTRAALVSAAQKELSAHGYGRATAKTIAKRAGVSVGTFYQYFKDKDAVLRELGRERFERISAHAVAMLTPEAAPQSVPLQQQVRARMRAIVEAVAEYHREDPGLHEVLHQRRGLDPELAAMTNRAEHLLLTRIAAQLASWGHPGDTEATAFVLFGMVEGSVHAHVLGHALVDDDRFFTALVDALVRVATPPPTTDSPR